MFAILVVFACLLAALPTESVKLRGRAAENAIWALNSKECPRGFTHIPEVNGCYQAVLSNLDWAFAGLRCKTLHKDAHLVVINNRAENVALGNFLDRLTDSQLSDCFRFPSYWALGTPFWTAGQRFEPNTPSQFVWRMAQDVCIRPDAVTELTYTNWEAGEPSSGDGQESCLQICRGTRYTWNDHFCNTATCSVCEIDL